MLRWSTVGGLTFIDWEWESRGERGWPQNEGGDWLLPMVDSLLATFEHIVEGWPPRLDGLGHSQFPLI